MSKKRNSKKIFIGLVEIAGYYTNLAEGLRDMGYEVHFAGSGSHIFKYDNGLLTQVAFVVRIYNYLLSKRTATSRKLLLTKIFWGILVEIWKLPLFCWSVFACDVFIFSFGTSFAINNIDLCLLRFLGKRIICNVGHGAEARPPYIDGISIYDDDSNWSSALYKSRIKKIKRKLSIIERYSCITICSPLTGHFLQKRFINFLHIGVPTSVKGVTYSTKANTDVISLLHAPSNKQVKGTKIIRATIDKLIKKGYKIDYNEITGRPNREVLEAIQRADLIIDQLYSDTPLAGFASEGAWLGKASLVGGYAWDILAEIIPSDKFPPSIIFHSNDLELCLESILNKPDVIVEYGKSISNFVVENWSIAKVASCYISLINNTIPDSWWYNPLEIRYTSGSGLNSDRVRLIVKNIIDQYGVAELGLEHNKELEMEFCKLCISKNA